MPKQSQTRVGIYLMVASILIPTGAALMLLTGQGLPDLAIPELPAIPEVAVVDENHTAKLEFSGYIDEDSSAKFIANLRSALDQGAKSISIRLNSDGGDFDSAHLMSQAVEDATSKATIECIVDGDALSAAFYFLQSCQTRIATARSVFMAHEPYFQSLKVANRARMTDSLVQIKTMSIQYSEQCAARMKISAAEFRKKIYNTDWWMTPKEALDLGIVDQVIPSPNSSLVSKKKTNKKPDQK